MSFEQENEIKLMIMVVFCR